MSFEFSQLIDGCLKSKQQTEQLTLPKLPKIVSSDALKITFEPPDSNEAINEIDLLTRFPVMESDYVQAELVELNLLNGIEPNRDQNELNQSSSNKSGEQIDTDSKAEEKRNIYEAWLEFETTRQLEFHPGDSIGTFWWTISNDSAFWLTRLIILFDFNFNALQYGHPIKVFQLAITTPRSTSSFDCLVWTRKRSNCSASRTVPLCHCRAGQRFAC